MVQKGIMRPVTIIKMTRDFMVINLTKIIIVFIGVMDGNSCTTVDEMIDIVRSFEIQEEAIVVTTIVFMRVENFS